MGQSRLTLLAVTVGLTCCGITWAAASPEPNASERGSSDARSQPEGRGVGTTGDLASRAPISDTDFVYFSPQDYFRVAVPPGPLRFEQAIMVDHSTPMTSLTIPISYSGMFPTLTLDSTVITAPDVRGVSFGPLGHDSLWTHRLVLVDNVNMTLLLVFEADVTVGPLGLDTLCILHWLVPDPYAIPSVSWVILDTMQVSGHHLQIATLADTLTPTWSAGSIQVGEIGVQDSEFGAPADLSIEVQPNPFNSQVRIHYRLQTPDQVRLTVYNMLGRRVREWPTEIRTAGPHALRWDGRNEQGVTVGSGVYYFLLEYGGKTSRATGVMLK